MTYVKKTLSVMLALVMAFSAFACLGSAYEVNGGTSVADYYPAFTQGPNSAVKTYAQLAAEYGGTSVWDTTPWVYFAVEVLESDGSGNWVPTDHYVQPGQQLKIRYYLKSNALLTVVVFHQLATLDLFDGFYTGMAPIAGSENMVSCGHPFEQADRYAGFVKVYETDATTNIKNGVPSDVLLQVGALGYNTSQNVSKTTSCVAFTSDLPIGEITRTVGELDEGTVAYLIFDEGNLKVNNSTAKCTVKLPDPTKVDTTDPEKTLAKNIKNDSAWTGTGGAKMTAADIFTADCNHVFTIGDAPSVTGFNATFMDGATELTSFAVTSGTTANMPSATDVTKAGYTLIGWSDGTNTYAPGTQNVALTANTTFTAVWGGTANFIVEGAPYGTAQTVATGAQFTAPAAPAGDFLGWYVQGDANETLVSFPYTANGDVTFVAKFNVVVKHFVYFYDGTELVDSAEVAEGAAIEYPTLEARTGFTYEWDTPNAVMGTTDMTINVVWTATGSAINFVTNGGTTVTAITGSYGDVVSAPAEPTKTGYSFGGWFTDNTTFQNAYTFTTLPLEAVTVYAKWNANQYDANFYITGEAEPYAVVSDVDFDTAFQAPALPEETGYTFSAWTPASFVMDAEGKDYYTTKTPNQVSITFKSSTGVTLQSGTQAYNAVLSCPNPGTVEGKTFAGWGTSAGEVIIAASAIGTATVPADATTYYACFTDTLYTLTYKVDGEIYTTEQYAANAKITLVTYTAAPGKSFSGWTCAYTKMPAADIEATGTTSDIQYNINYYAVNDDTQAFATFTATYGQAVPAPTNTPSREGYEWGGWDNSETTVSSNLVIYGTWSAEEYTLVFTDGADNELQYPTYYGETFTKAAIEEIVGNTFDVTGKTYVWTYDDEAITFPFVIPALDNGDTVELVASYSDTNYTITYWKDGVKTGTVDTYTYGQQITLAALPTKTGTTYTAWAYSNGNPAPTTMPAENIDLYTTGSATVYHDVWMYGDDVVDERDVAYGAAIPVIAIPELPDGATGAYWDPQLTTQPVGNQTFTLQVQFGTVQYAIETYKQAYIEGVLGYELAGTKTSSATAGAHVTATATAIRGYVYDEDNALGVAEADVAGNGSTVLKLYYNLDEYTLEVVDNGVTTPVTYKYTQAIVTPTAAGKTGYSFDSWTWTLKSNGASISAPETMPYNDIVATAKYNINKYDLVPVVDDVEGTATQVTFGTAIPELAAQTKTGYTFHGWYTDSDYETAYVFGSAMPADTVKVYGYFTINTYNLILKDGNETIDTIPFEYGAAVTGVEDASKTGSEFKGWSPALPTTMPANDVTVNAIFERIDYNVNFVVDENTTTKTAKYGDPLPTVTNPAKVGYVFTGWLDADNKAPSDYASMPANALTFTAQFELGSFDAKFYADGELVDTKADVEYGDTFAAPETDPEKAFYTFKGWKLTGTADTAIVEFPYTMNAEGLSFTAVFEYNSDSCRVASVERVTTPYYSRGEAQYKITLADGIEASKIFVYDGTKTIKYSKATFDVYGTETSGVVSITEVEGAQVWVVKAVLAAAANTYKAYCESTDGTADTLESALPFDVAYDTKDDEVVAAEIKSAAISGTEVLRGEYLTWTFTTSTDVTWIKLATSYTVGETTKNLTTLYKYTNSSENIVITDSGDTRTWSITMRFTYASDDVLYVVENWAVSYRVGTATDWFAYETLAPEVTVYAVEDYMPTTTYAKYTLVSAAPEAASVTLNEYKNIVIKTTDDCDKVRISVAGKSATYQKTSKNVTVDTESEEGFITWTISYKFTKSGSNEYSVCTRGTAWGDAKTFTVAAN